MLLMFFTRLDDCLHSIPKYATMRPWLPLGPFFNSTPLSEGRKGHRRNRSWMQNSKEWYQESISFLFEKYSSNILAYSISDETFINGHGTRRRRPLSDHRRKDFNWVFYCEPFWPKHAHGPTIIMVKNQ